MTGEQSKPLLYNEVFVSQSSSQDVDDNHEVFGPSRASIASTSVVLPELPVGVKMWSPTAFNRKILFLSLSLVVLAVVILEVVLQLSNHQTGFPEPNPVVHQLITFTPLIFLIIAGAFWHVYDLEVKKLVPWAAMQNDTPAPRKTNPLLLDYVGANYLVTLLQAIRNKHWSVILVVLGGILLAISTILATSLFALLPRTLPKSTQINLLGYEAFDSSNFNKTAATNHIWLSNFLASPSDPAWQTDSLAFLRFRDFGSDDKNTILTGPTLAYGANLDCRASKPSNVVPNAVKNGTTHVHLRISLSESSCEQALTITDAYLQSNAQGISHYGGVYNSTCPGYDQTVALARYDGSEFKDVVALVCSTTFTEYNASVSVNATSGTFTDPPQILSSRNISVHEGARLLSWLDAGPPNEDGREILNHTIGYWIGLVAQTSNHLVDDLMDADTFARESKITFERIFVYLARRAYVRSSSTNLVGLRTLSGPRLLAQGTTIRLLQGVLVVFAAVTIALHFVRPRPQLVRDPGPIIAVASVLQESPALEQNLAGYGNASKHEIEEHLKDSVVVLSVNGSGMPSILITTTPQPPPVRVGHSKTSTEEELWRPIMLRNSAKAILAAILSACILALELLCRRSLRNDGLYSVFKGRWDQQHAPSFIAATLLFVFGLGVVSFDFAVRTSVLFRQMNKLAQPANVTSYNPLLLAPPLAFWTALRRRQLAVVVSTFAILLITASKIVISGVFVVENTMVGLDHDFKPLTQFATGRIAPRSSELTLSDEELFTLRNSFGLNFSPWVTPILALGSVDVEGSLNGGDNVTATYADVPALFANIVNCTVIPTDVKITTNISARHLPLSTHASKDDDQGQQSTKIDSGCTTSSSTLLMPPTAGFFGMTRSLCRTSTMFTFGQRQQDSQGSWKGKALTVMCNNSLSSFDIGATISLKPSGAQIVSAHFDTITNRAELSFPWTTIGISSNWKEVPEPGANGNAFDFFFTLVTKGKTETELQALLDPRELESQSRNTWQSYWAYYMHRRLRIEASDSAEHVPGKLLFRGERMTMDPTATRVVEVLLGAVILSIIVVSLWLPSFGMHKEPFSLAAQMGLLAGSRLLELRRLGSLERWSGKSEESVKLLDRTSGDYHVRLGWWRRHGELRYGIDICYPEEEDVGGGDERPKFVDEKAW